LLQFLREENAANRIAVRDDAEANRRLLLDTVKFVSIPTSLLIAIAALLGFKSLSDLKGAIRSEARSETQAEIMRMQGEIRQRLNAQFQTPELQKMVKEAASESTKAAAAPLIKSEVAAQVKSRVDAEQPAISAAVTRQTHAAVQEMEPQITMTIKESVEKEIETNVAPLQHTIVDLKTEVQPLAQSLGDLKAETNLEHIITRMKSDDAIAFDQAVSLYNQTFDLATKSLLGGSLTDVMESPNNTMRIVGQFTNPHTEEQSIAELSNPDPIMRVTALDIVGNKIQMSKLVDLLSSDPSLKVRCVAAQMFDGRTKQHFLCLAKEPILAWWEANKQNFQDTAK
jgi:hypothetical protein